MINTPIVFIIFNRPDKTAEVFEAIRAARPSKLLLIADGPRQNRQGEVDKCAQTRAIVDKIDWPCEVIKNFSETNLGCKKRISSGLDWAFDQVESAIILEDDCLPDSTFFRFCEELLYYYRDDERISHIGGANFQFGNKRTEHSYYFSRYTHVWGWASWRRAWKNYDVEMKLWPELRDSKWLKNWLVDARLVKYWTKIFDKVYYGKIDTWDYQWTFSCWSQERMSVIPNVNLITNIGFGSDATHTMDDNAMAGIPVIPMEFPLSHPYRVIRNTTGDMTTERLYLPPTKFHKNLNKIKSFFSNF